MYSRSVTKSIVAALTIICSLEGFTASAQSANKAAQPNVIIIYADDLGWNQLSSYGNTKVQTPNIDAIGKKGVRFTQAYATAPICSPSRMGLLTGRYQQRFGGEYLVPELRPTPLTDPELIAKIRPLLASAPGGAYFEMVDQK